MTNSVVLFFSSLFAIFLCCSSWLFANEWVTSTVKRRSRSAYITSHWCFYSAYAYQSQTGTEKCVGWTVWVTSIVLCSVRHVPAFQLLRRALINKLNNKFRAITDETKQQSIPPRYITAYRSSTCKSMLISNLFQSRNSKNDRREPAEICLSLWPPKFKCSDILSIIARLLFNWSVHLKLELSLSLFLAFLSNFK